MILFRQTIMLIYSVFTSLMFISGASGDDPVFNGGELKSVTISAKREVPDIYRDHHDILSRLVYSEAGHESFTGKRAVADVVMNIARSKGITITEAIMLPGIFDGIKYRTFKSPPPDVCIEAARLSLVGDHVLPEGVLFFFNPVAASDSKWIRHISQFRYKQIGNHVFCYDPAVYKKLKKKLRKNLVG